MRLLANRTVRRTRTSTIELSTFFWGGVLREGEKRVVFGQKVGSGGIRTHASEETGA